jgi:hypothetical protein
VPSGNILPHHHKDNELDTALDLYAVRDRLGGAETELGTVGLYTLVHTPGVQPPPMQKFRTAELQLRLAKKAVVAQWSRIANPKFSPWGGAFATEFQPFADELAGDAPAYEAPVRPAAAP